MKSTSNVTRNIGIVLVMILALTSFASALVVTTGTIAQSTERNLTLNFTSNVTMSALEVQSWGLGFYDVVNSNSDYITYNATMINESWNFSNMPYLTGTLYTRHILCDPITNYTDVSVKLSTGTPCRSNDLYVIYYSDKNNFDQNKVPYTCEGDLVSITGLTVECPANESNIITIVPLCNDSEGNLLYLLSIVFILGIVMFIWGITSSGAITIVGIVSILFSIAMFFVLRASLFVGCSF